MSKEQNPLDTMTAEELKLKVLELERSLEATKTSADTANQEAKRAKTAMIETQKTVILRDAARAANIADVDGFIKLAKSDIQFDESLKEFVVSTKGGYAVNSSLKPKTATEYALDFVASKPYWGATPSIPGANVAARGGAPPEPPEERVEDFFGKNAKGNLTIALKRRDPKKYDAMRARAIEKGLIPG